MGTRSGDVDPAVLEYIMDNTGMDIHQMLNALNKKSGYAGLSVSSEMRDVQNAAAAGDEQAQTAIDIWTYRLQKYIGAYMAAVGGADAIVMTGGIGENSSDVRARIINRLGALGIKLDKAANNKLHGEIGTLSAKGSTIPVVVLPTNEELMIAKDTVKVLS
jgi:acetate kinase